VTLPVAILAGGLATRLRPMTETIPKALVEVAGQPFVFHQLEWLKGQGVRKVVLCIGYRGEQVQEAVGNGRRFGLRVEYSLDGDHLLGTGGALKKALPLLSDSFSILYGDSYLQCSLAEVEHAFRTAASPALMTVLRNEGRWDKSNVLFLDGKLVRYDKRNPSPDMQHIDYGLSIVRAEIFQEYPQGEMLDLANVLMTLSAKGELGGFEVSERFYEIGTQASLRETEHFLIEKEKDALRTKTSDRSH
jgi:NDP-sugar pyrophosphorylase family protein